MSPRSICSMSPSGISRAALIVVAPEPSLLLSALPIVVLYRLVAGGFDVGRVDDEALVDRQQVLAFDDELGHWDFSCLIPSKPREPRQLLLKGRAKESSIDSGSGYFISTVETLSSTDWTSDTSKSDRDPASPPARPVA